MDKIKIGVNSDKAKKVFNLSFETSLFSNNKGCR